MSSSTKDGYSNPVGGMAPKSKQQNQDLHPLLGVPPEHKLHNCDMYTEGLGQSHACSLDGGSVSVSHYDPRLVSSVGFLVVLLSLPAPTKI